MFIKIHCQFSATNQEIVLLGDDLGTILYREVLTKWKPLSWSCAKTLTMRLLP